MEELVTALQELDADEAVRCIVLGGNERAFAAGADVAELTAGTSISLYQERRIDPGMPYAACARPSSPPCPVSASAAGASSRWRAT